MIEADTSVYAALRGLADDGTRERIHIADLMLALGDRAVVVLVLLFALPNAVPMPPGTSAVLGAPLLLLSVQWALGLDAWLPDLITRRSITKHHFIGMVDRAQPWHARTHHLIKPRLQWLARPPWMRLAGAFGVVLAIIVFLPIPFGNMLPAAAISLMALGVMHRDGACMLVGIVAGVIAISLLWGVAWPLIHGALNMALRQLG
jgi:hypothetical protein